MVINKMKTDNFKIIIVGVLLAIGIFYFFPLIHTILYFMQIRLEKPLGAYFRMMVYLPLIVAGIYVGFSKAEQNVLHGALVVHNILSNFMVNN